MLPGMAEHAPNLGPQTAPQAAPDVSARQAADALGVHERTVRRWIDGGRLAATKDESGVYHIAVTDLARLHAERRRCGVAAAPHLDAAPAADARTQAARLAAPGIGDAASQAAGLDLRPLVEHIASLERNVERLTEAATVWQVRALQAEERAEGLEQRLKQLTAGDVAQDAVELRSAPPPAAEEPGQTPATPSPIRAWWTRLWGGS